MHIMKNITLAICFLTTSVLFCSQVEVIAPTMALQEVLNSRNQNNRALTYLGALPREIQAELLRYLYPTTVLTAALKIQESLANPAFQPNVPKVSNTKSFEMPNIHSAHFIANGTQILVIFRNGTLKIFDRNTNNELFHVKMPAQVHRFPKFDVKKNTLLLQYTNGINEPGQFFELWDIPTGKLIEKIEGQRAIFNHDGSIIAYANGSDKDYATHDIIYIFNVADSTQYKLRYTAPGFTFVKNRNSRRGPRNEMLLTIDRDGQERLWSLEEKKVMRDVPVYWNPLMYARSLISKNGLAAMYDDKDRKSIHFLDLYTDQSSSLLRTDQEILQFAFSPSGDYLTATTASGDRTIFVWDTATKRLVHKLQLPYDFYHQWIPAGKVSFLASETIIMAHFGNGIDFFDLKTGQHIHNILAAENFKYDENHSILDYDFQNGRIRIFDLYSPEALAMAQQLTVPQTMLVKDALRAAQRAHIQSGRYDRMHDGLDLATIAQSAATFQGLPEPLKFYIQNHCRLIRTRHELIALHGRNALNKTKYFIKRNPRTCIVALGTACATAYYISKLLNKNKKEKKGKPA